MMTSLFFYATLICGVAAALGLVFGGRKTTGFGGLLVPATFLLGYGYLEAFEAEYADVPVGFRPNIRIDLLILFGLAVVLLTASTTAVIKNFFRREPADGDGVS